MMLEEDLEYPTADLTKEGLSELKARIGREVPKLASLDRPARDSDMELDAALAAHHLHGVESNLDTLWPAD